MNDSVLKPLIGRGESGTLELKVNYTTPDVLAKSVVAFLNAAGGMVVVGVTEDGHIRGVRDPDGIVRILRKKLEELVSPRAAVSINSVEIDGRPVIVIDVPIGGDRPYTAANRIYVRTGTSTREASGQDISELIASRRSESVRWERQVAPGVSLNDLDRDEIGRTASDSQELISYDDPRDSFKVLDRLGVLLNDSISNSGLVLFGQLPVRRFPQIRVRAVSFDDIKGSRLKDNKILEGHAFHNLRAIEDFLRSYVPIRSEMPTVGMRRVEKRAYPFAALREATMNAIIHRDYAAFDGGVAVTAYPDRIEIWNSGRLPDGMVVADLKKPHPSRPTNPDIAHVFLVRGLIERLGIGTRRMVEQCRDAGLPEPEWREDANGVTVVIRLAGGRRIVGETELNRRQRELAERLEPGERITYRRYFGVVSRTVKERQARADLRLLVQAGFLRQEGRGRLTEYVRTEKSLPS